MLRFGRIEIDVGARQVRLDGEERPLTGYQFELLLALAQHAGRVMSRDALMDLVKQRAAGGVRPLDRRAHLAHPRRDRGRSRRSRAASSPCAAPATSSPRRRMSRGDVWARIHKLRVIPAKAGHPVCMALDPRFRGDERSEVANFDRPNDIVTSRMHRLYQKIYLAFVFRAAGGADRGRVLAAPELAGSPKARGRRRDRLGDAAAGGRTSSVQQEAVDQLAQRLRADVGLFDEDLQPILMAGRPVPPPSRFGTAAASCLAHGGPPGRSLCRRPLDRWRAASERPFNPRNRPDPASWPSRSRSRCSPIRWCAA